MASTDFELSSRNLRNRITRIIESGPYMRYTSGIGYTGGTIIYRIATIAGGLTIEILEHSVECRFDHPDRALKRHLPCDPTGLWEFHMHPSDDIDSFVSQFFKHIDGIRSFGEPAKVAIRTDLTAEAARMKEFQKSFSHTG